MRILTGRTHQIRVHMAFIGHPLVGDEKYNPACFEQDTAIVPRIFLHCLRMQFEDMDTCSFEAASDLSPELQIALLRIHELASTVASGAAGTAAVHAPPAAVGFPGLARILEHTKTA